MKRFIVNLPDEVHERIRQQAFKNHKSMSQIIVDVLSTPENVPPAAKGTLSKESQNTGKPVVTPSERKESVLSKIPQELKKTFIQPRGELDIDNYI